MAASTVSHIETGLAPARTSYVNALLSLYGLADPDERRRLTGLEDAACQMAQRGAARWTAPPAGDHPCSANPAVSNHAVVVTPMRDTFAALTPATLSPKGSAYLIAAEVTQRQPSPADGKLSRDLSLSLACQTN